jgi:hypothetical protein
MILPLSSLVGFGEETSASLRSIRYRPVVDWRLGRITIEASIAQHPLNPKSRYEAEEVVQYHISSLYLASLRGMAVDSNNLVSELIGKDKQLLARIEELSMAGRRAASSFSADLQEVVTSYHFPLYGEGGLFDPFVAHRRPFPVRRALDFVPTERFTGLVIYAKGRFPVHGENREAAFRPALFPRIFDEQMNLVLDRYRCDPQALRKWGMVAYTDSVDTRSFSPRIGVSPLHVMARGVFGRNRTDIVIPTQKVEQLLAIEENRALLVEGRILIILEDEELTYKEGVFGLFR